MPISSRTIDADEVVAEETDVAAVPTLDMLLCSSPLPEGKRSGLAALSAFSKSLSTISMFVKNAAKQLIKLGQSEEEEWMLRSIKVMVGPSGTSLLLKKR